MNRAGTRTVSGILENLDQNSDVRFGILPKVISIRGTGKLAPPLWLVAFHELTEAYGKIDAGKQYGGPNGTHQEAFDREAILRGQRQGRGICSLGGVPEATFLKLGPKNTAIHLSGPWPYTGVQQRTN
jgi:hypothetical protein